MGKPPVSVKVCAAQLRVAVVAARWNEDISEALLEGAVSALEESGCPKDNIDVFRVPGCFEIPLACLEATKSYDAVVATGTLIKGDTDHYRLIADQLSAGLQNVMLETGVPVGFGVITADTVEQALARAGGDEGNKGTEAALAAVEMTNVLSQISGVTK